LENLIKKYNTEDLLNAIIVMSADRDQTLTDVNISACEWIASNTIRNNIYGSVEFDINAYREMKQIANKVYEPYIKEIFSDVMNHKNASNDKKEDFLKSTMMRIKNLASRGDAYQFQLMELAEKFYKPFDLEFLNTLGFSFTCCERVFVYIYLRYMKVLEGIESDRKRIESIQNHIFKISKLELYQFFSAKEVDRLIECLSIKPGDSKLNPVQAQDFKPLYSKPLVDYGEYIYLPLPVPVLLNFPKIFHYKFIAEKIFNKDVVAEYTKNRGDVIESLTSEYLLRLFDNVYISLEYPPDSRKFEADITAQSENTTVFAEAKGKILTLSSLNGDLLSINDDIYKAIGKAYDQAVRSIEHVENGGLFIEKKETEEKEIVLENTTWKFPLCIMSENFSSIPSEIYKHLDIQKEKLIPYAVNIYDLDIITRECISKEEFINYLLFRQINIHKLTTMDELDYFGYFKHNGLVEIKTDADDIMAISFTDEFDKKYYNLTIEWFEKFDFGKK